MLDILHQFKEAASLDEREAKVFVDNKKTSGFQNIARASQYGEAGKPSNSNTSKASAA